MISRYQSSSWPTHSPSMNTVYQNKATIKLKKMKKVQLTESDSLLTKDKSDNFPDNFLPINVTFA